MRRLVSPLDGIRSPFGPRFGTAFSPASLFAAGEQGVWYDPSDFSTMFQDSAGTTPVTAVEQPVGRILDKSGRGNTATQATSASRPVLSARVNLLTYSEQFDNAAWTKLNATITANQDTAPDGTLTADLVAATAAGEIRVGISSGVAASTSYTATISGKYINANGRYLWFRDFYASKDTGFDLQSGVVTTTPSGVTASISLQANGYYRCVVSWTTPAAPVVVNQQYWVQSASGSNVSGGQTGGQCYIWGADLRVTNDTALPAYQRVNTSTDYDTTGFPLYLRFDGTDDSLATATFTPGTDKAQVFSGVRKLSDAAAQIYVELSGSWAGTPGALALYQDSSGPQLYASASRGNASVNANQVASVSTVFSAPRTNVITSTHDIASDSTILRANGSQIATATGDKGTGNFLAYPLYIGRRGGTSLPYNGRIYSLIIRFGANLDATTISNTETWVNARTMAY